MTAGSSTAGRFLPHHEHLTLRQKVSYFQRSIRKDQTAIAWLTSRRAPRTLQRVSELGWSRRALRWHTALLRRYSAKLAPVYNDLGAWTCIHGYEGSWTDPDGPYYGGLQMDLGFQQTYGADFLARWGTADHWPIWAQLTAARRARDGYHGYAARGYGPWPNTARYCGLL